MSAELAEEYDRLVRPELYAEADRQWKLLAEEMDWPSLEALKMASRTRWKERFSTHDQAILAAAGMTVDDLIKAREAKIADRHAGQKRGMKPGNVGQRRTALLAIREADQAGLSWWEAIEKAQLATDAAHNRQHDRKTLDSWLRTLHQWGLIGISPPSRRGRGRPRKKE